MEQLLLAIFFHRLLFALLIVIAAMDFNFAKKKFEIIHSVWYVSWIKWNFFFFLLRITKNLKYFFWNVIKNFITKVYNRNITCNFGYTVLICYNTDNLIFDEKDEIGYFEKITLRVASCRKTLFFPLTLITNPPSFQSRASSGIESLFNT